MYESHLVRHTSEPLKKLSKYYKLGRKAGKITKMKERKRKKKKKSSALFCLKCRLEKKLFCKPILHSFKKSF